jgi:hypothetical protein
VPADQDLEDPVSDQLMQRHQLFVGFKDCGGLVRFHTRPASVDTSPAISHSVMKRSTAVGNLAETLGGAVLAIKPTPGIGTVATAESSPAAHA